MSTILFLLAIAAFVAVVVWTYANDGLGAEAGHRGILAMRDAGGASGETRAGPRWKGSPAEHGGEADAAVRRPAPPWRSRNRGPPRP